MVDTAALAILGIVLAAVIAIRYEPRRKLAGWAVLSEAFATNDRPRSFRFLSRRLFFSPIVSRFVWPRIFAGEYGTFDVETDARGIWMLYRGPEPKKCADCLLIPWASISRASRAGDKISLELEARWRMWVELPPDLGAAALKAMG